MKRMKKVFGVVCIASMAMVSSVSFAFDGKQTTEKKAEHEARMVEHQEQVTTYVAENNFAGYTVYMDAQHEEKRATAEAAGKKMKEGREGKQMPSDEEKKEKMQKHFDAMVRHYAEEKSLDGYRSENKKKHMKKKTRKHYKENHRGMVESYC
jgi:hypothetical protein